MAGRLARVYEKRSLLFQLVLRDLRSRYAGSVAGVSWSVLTPMALLAIYLYVFAAVLRIRWPGSDGTATTVLLLLSGLLPWLSIQEGIARATRSVVDNSHLLRSCPFPAKILPCQMVLSSLAGQLVGLAVLVAALAWLGRAGASLVLLPLVVALQVAFCLGVGWILAALHVRCRDTGAIVNVAMLLWFFATPIVYPPESVPESLRAIVRWNPLAHLVAVYRGVLAGGVWPSPVSLAAVAVAAAVCCAVGYLLFERWQPEFVDYV
jgi:lipopolysaccharide transport system permease protein